MLQTSSMPVRSVAQALAMVVTAALLVAGGPGASAAPGPHAQPRHKPVLKALSQRTSLPIGGARVTLRGAHLTPKPVVTFGQRKAKVVAAKPNRLVVEVPANVEGPAPVRVTTRYGKSRTQAFSYTSPADTDTAVIEPQSSTVTLDPSDVHWVDGGPDPDNLPDTAWDPWTVSLAPGVQLPAHGAGLYLPAGSAVYPQGLAGTVGSIATQIDGSARVTVEPTPLDDTFSDLSIAYSGDGSTGAPARAVEGEVTEDFGSQVSFPRLGPGLFNCEDDDRQSVTFQGEVGVRFTRFRPSFFKTLSPLYVSAWIAGEVETYGQVSVQGSMTCKLKPSWSNANRRVIPLGTTGLTLSFGPTASIEISGRGQVTFSQKTRFMYGVDKADGQPITWYRILRGEDPTTTGSASLSVEVSLGGSVQFGILDRVGVEAKAQVYVEGTLTAQTRPLRVCADVNLGGKLSVGAFLDAWVARWEATAMEVKIEFSALHACTEPDEPLTPSTDPEIASGSLPEALVGDYYETALEVADDRLGVWSLVSGGLPAGLALDRDGTLAGTPRAVGTWTPRVRFVDGSERSATAVLRLVVRPDAGLGGGDMQVTLTWSGPADLDLHAEEPDGNEISFRDRGPSDGGGELDHDSNAGCNFVDAAPAENIHWPAEQAISGTYLVWVETYDDCGTDQLSWHLVVRVRGQVVVDETGYDDSYAYEIAYGAGGRSAVQVRRVEAPEAVSRPGKA